MEVVFRQLGITIKMETKNNNLIKTILTLSIVFLIGMFMVPNSSAIDLTEGLYYYFDFNNASEEPNVTDRVFGLSNGVLDRPSTSGYPNYTAFALLGNAVQFDGLEPGGLNANYATLDSTYTDYNPARTISVWFAMNRTGNTNGVINQTFLNDDGSGGFLWNVNSVDKTGLTVGASTGTCTGEVFAVISPGERSCMINNTLQIQPDGVFHHAVVSYNDTLVGYDFWIDGIQYVDIQNGGFPQQPLVANKINIGRDNNGVESYFNGTIDEFGIWNRSLTGAEIVALYNGGAGIPYEALGGGTAPYWTTIPANATAVFGTEISETFVAVDDDGDFSEYLVDDTTHFAMDNVTGVLTNATVLGAGEYVLSISATDLLGNINVTAWNATVTQAAGTCTLSFDPGQSVDHLEAVNVTGACDTVISAFTQDGGDDSANNGLFVNLVEGTYDYVVTGTSSQNFSAGMASATLTVGLRTGIQAVCEDSDVTFSEASQLAGLILTILLVGLVLGTLILSVTGVIDIQKLGGVMTLENAPAMIVVIGLTFLVLATMSFLIASNVCVAFGA